MSIRINNVRRFVVALIGALSSADAVLWAPSESPERSAGDRVFTAKVVRGPALASPTKVYASEPTQLTYTVTAATAGSRIGTYLVGREWSYDVVSGNSIEDARDGFLAAFNTTYDLPGVTLTTSSTDSIVLDASGVPGRLWGHEVFGSVTRVINAEVPCEVITRAATLTIELQAYSTVDVTDAQSMMSDVVGGLIAKPSADLRTKFGVSIVGSASEPLDLTALAGAEFESRSVARIAVSTRSYRATPTDTVTSVTLNASTDVGDLGVVSV